MRTAIIEIKFSPPDRDLDSAPGLRPDRGGYVYRVRYEDGQLRLCGTSRGTDAECAHRRALLAARKSGFTHYFAQDNATLSLSETPKQGI